MTHTDAVNGSGTRLIRGLRRRLARLRGAGEAIRLQIGNAELRWDDPEDFEFALAGRTTVPAEKFGDILRMQAPALKAEARAIRQMEKRFVAALEAALTEPTSFGARLQELGAGTFSKDHRWRAIAVAVAALGPQHDEARRLLLVKYMQYLAARLELVTLVHAALTGRGTDTDWDHSPSAAAALQTAVLPEPVLQEPGHRYLNAYTRLPRGEPTLVRLPPDRDTDILLSTHRFRVGTSADGLRLVDADGRVLTLGKGPQRTGRQPDNDLVIDNAWRCVSRRHCILEAIAPLTLRMTDLSSHGTFVPPELLVADGH